MISSSKRTKVLISLELVKNLRAREQRETHASLQENVATLVHKEAVKRLDRNVEGDDDQEFYATMDQIVEETWNQIENDLRNLLADS